MTASGTRTLTALGRWEEALSHIEKYRGVGKRMLDGRQVAVLTALTVGDTERATELLASTAPGDPWEQAVTACLTVLCHRHAGKPVDDLADLVDTCIDREAATAMTVFTSGWVSRSSTVGSAEDPAARRIVEDLHRRTTDAQVGYAARESLAHPLFLALATDRQVRTPWQVGGALFVSGRDRRGRPWLRAPPASPSHTYLTDSV